MREFDRRLLPDFQGILSQAADLEAGDDLGALLLIQRALQHVPGIEDLGLCDLSNGVVLRVASKTGLSGHCLFGAGAPETKALCAGHSIPLGPDQGVQCGVLLPLSATRQVIGALLLSGPVARDPQDLRDAAGDLLGLGGLLLSRINSAAPGPGAAASTPPPASPLEDLGRLTVSVAHELGGPLQAITSLAEVLSRRPDHEQRQESARRILRSALRCRSLAQDLLSLGRSSAGSRRVVQIPDVLMDALELDRFSDVGEVQLDITDEGPLPAVQIEPRRLTQVLLNLLTNARHATKDLGRPGLVKVRVLHHQSAEGPAGRVHIRISDNGPGIPPELVPGLFEPFITSRSGGEGTGLGLYISRRLVEEMDGRLDFDPHATDSPGATFVVDLPAADAVADPLAQNGRKSEDAACPPIPTAPMDVLVVDDDREVLETYEVVLSLGAHRVVTTDRATKALERTEHQQFGAIICDLRLPDLSGSEFHAQLMVRDPSQAQRVIFATGDVMNEELKDRLEALDNPVLYKPFQAEDLERALAQVEALG